MKTKLTLLLIIFTWIACDRKDDITQVPGAQNEEGTKVTLAFTNEYSPLGRAFQDATATAVEKKVNYAKIYIFQSGGNKIFEKDLTAAEITNIGTTAITFTVPGMLPSTPYNYYVVINRQNISPATVTALNAITESDISSYNGLWNTVADNASAPLRTDGFVMNGTQNVSTTTDITQTQNVSITVKRIVAKLDIQANIDQTIFGAGKKYPGTLVIDSAKITQTQASTPLIGGTPTTTTGTQTLGKQLSNAQTANTTYQNRFYLFENGTLGAGSRVVLTLYGTYTNDGVSSLVTYTTEITGTSTNGSIIRNGAYAINIGIKGLTGTPVSISITLSDWETIVTQSTNIGS